MELRIRSRTTWCNVEGAGIADVLLLVPSFGQEVSGLPWSCNRSLWWPLWLVLVVGVLIRSLGTRVPCGPGEIPMAVSDVSAAKGVEIVGLCCVVCWVTSGRDSCWGHWLECGEQELQNLLGAKLNGSSAFSERTHDCQRLPLFRRLMLLYILFWHYTCIWMYAFFARMLRLLQSKYFEDYKF